METEFANQNLPLKITFVSVTPFKDEPYYGHIKGLATIYLNDALVVRGLRVMEGEDGYFIGYPNDPFYKGEEFRYIVNPITLQLREHIEEVILKEYARLTGKEVK